MHKPPCVLSLNPCMDVEWKVSSIKWEEKNVIDSEHRWAGGKGVNVARWLKYLNSQARLLVPLGGPNGMELEQCLKKESIPAHIVPIQGNTRCNTLITSKDCSQMRFNQLGPVLAKKEWQSILKTTESLLKQSGLLVLSGSLPQGVPVDAYNQLIKLASRHGIKTVLDCDGPAFARAAKAKPFLVKPNLHELSQWHGRALKSERAILNAAKELARTIKGWVVVSRGEQGALILNEDGDGANQPAPKVKVLNKLGAGDAMLAGIVRQMESPKSTFTGWLASGILTGAAAVQCQAGCLPHSS